ncbi:MAG: hypothetical protein KKD38_02100 [Candidatus Delongbacteria bacterium]|nr:hypothetical protein [Candidatus Delongbacteria bacterium]
MGNTEIFIALIAISGSFIGLIITKESKISEFRQKWIDNLRDDISKLMGSLCEFSTSRLITNHSSGSPETEKDKQFIQNNLQVIKEIFTLLHRITLRLNPKKDIQLINVLNQIEVLLTEPSMLDNEKCFEFVTNDLKLQSHDLLKREWERVKKGEPFYIIMHYIVLTLFIVIFTIAIMNIICKFL